ncbi:cytochrome c nitrite reductase pentaheme subunit [Photobacterium chitinilyticum]|uniref:Cytochrome c nitrite reductase pentaheme subunit n=1 Tax=Photobacterium chitinilyticum TaxID=2485123 RepID=A0A3S3QRE0_9GAMM|nr:cytochrome c nitrite reductase pentaheme subunit [Photobacterium chitinilyticum]RWX56955.1 cytochrome c nitrite reductase pentaheme subunit [Photobacterium chitinilyticum]
MGNYKVAMNTVITFFVAICIFGFSMNVAADSKAEGATTANPSVISQESGQHVVEFIRDRDYACTQCHKDEKDTLKGAHGDVIHAQTNRDLTCTDCHSKVGKDHRDGAPQVTKFAAAQTVAGTEKPAADPVWIAKQNETCVNCHEPKDLREVNWTHDVHALDLSCASCHTIHPEKDPMKGIERKSKIKMCVDCHSDQKKEK